MFEVSRIDFVASGEHWIYDQIEKMLHPEIVKLMQFTGLKDKNGKEICEGDIVRRVYAFTKANKPKETTDQIVFSDEWGAFAFHSKTNIGKGWSRMYSGHKAFPFEVIGNIYENPELLKV